MINLIKFEITNNINNDRIYLTFEDKNKIGHTFSFTFDEILNKTKIENKIKTKFSSNQMYNDLYNLCKHCDSYQEFFNMSKDKINNETVNAYNEECDLWYQQSILLNNTIN